MAHVPVATIMANARLYADERATSFVTDAELLRLTNLAIAEHRDLLMQAQGPHNYEKEVAYGGTAGVDYIVLPETFYKLLSVHKSWNAAKTDLEEIPQLSHIEDRDVYINEGQPWAKGSFKACMLGGQGTENAYAAEEGPRLYLYPTPTSNFSAVTDPILVRYVQDQPTLTSGDELFIVNGHDRMISLRVACELRTIQGLPTTFLERRYEADRARIEEMAMNRSNEPSRVRDVEGRIQRPGIWRRLPRVF